MFCSVLDCFFFQNQLCPTGSDHDSRRAGYCRIAGDANPNTTNWNFSSAKTNDDQPNPIANTATVERINPT
jgi:hypothetical protein